MNTSAIKFLLIFLFTIHIQAFSQGEEELFTQLQQASDTKNSLKEAEILNKLAFYYWENNLHQKAIEQFEKSMVINIEKGNKNAQMHIYNNIAMIYTDIYQYESAILAYRKAFVIASEFNDKQQTASIYLNIGICLLKLERFNESIENVELALESAKSINNLKLIRSCYGTLSECYEKIGDNAKSMEYFNLYATFEKHIQKEQLKAKEEENKKIVAAAQEKVKVVEEHKKSIEKSLEQKSEELQQSQELSLQQSRELITKENEKKKLQYELKQKQITQIVIITGLLITLTLLSFIFRSNRLRKKANTKLEEQNKEILEQQEIIKKKNFDITKSINYAQRIQKAMLPEQELLNKYLDDAFIFFKPRDIVSGDFFWFNTTGFKSYVQQSIGNKSQPSDDLIITAADCTGHGVPGAFMSMIGYNILDQIVSNEVTAPNLILDILHIGVSRELKQQQTNNKDGMDIALCKINFDSKTVDFAGAKNPLVYVKNNEINIIKGDKFPIGGATFKKRTPFKRHSVSFADSPTSFYLYSDGFQDQFGGKDGTKYMSKKFRDLLFSISEKPMTEQKEILKQTLSDWMGDKYHQIDDILIIGFKLS